MEESINQEPLEGLLSTYQWVTVGRVLGRYGLSLSDPAVMALLRAKTSFYYQLLRIPLTNVLNGIILGQAREYQLFLQKLFVDYLVSGEADRSDEEPGEDTRETIEELRQSMLALSGEFEAAERAHEGLITESQRAIMTLMEQFIRALDQLKSQFKGISIQPCYDLFLDAKGFSIQDAAWARLEATLRQTLTTEQRQALQALFQGMDVAPLLADYEPKVQESRRALNQFRKQFYDKIIELQAVLEIVNAFQLDEKQHDENLAFLKFDSDIGAGF